MDWWMCGGWWVDDGVVVDKWMEDGWMDGWIRDEWWIDEEWMDNGWMDWWWEIYDGWMIYCYVVRSTLVKVEIWFDCISVMLQCWTGQHAVREAVKTCFMMLLWSWQDGFGAIWKRGPVTMATDFSVGVFLESLKSPLNIVFIVVLLVFKNLFIYFSSVWAFSIKYLNETKLYKNVTVPQYQEEVFKISY